MGMEDFDYGPMYSRAMKRRRDRAREDHDEKCRIAAELIEAGGFNDVLDVMKAKAAKDHGDKAQAQS